jgi:hypothetical protein
MKPMCTFVWSLTAILLLSSAEVGGQTPLGTEFTYQGQLKHGGVPVNGTADFEFTLWDDPNSVDPGHQVGRMVPVDDVNVVKGLFTVVLDFGEDIFTGEARWLEIAVRSPAGGGAFTTLDPRQPLTAAPYALYALHGPSSAGYWAANGDDIYNANSGRVGIGTTSPSHQLHVESAEERAIFGDNLATSGTAYGVYGRSNSTTGFGVYGEATAFSGGNFGVRGDTWSDTGVGVFGIAAMTTGINYGVYGQSQSPTGRGVCGLGNNAAGANYGVYGQTNSADGWAGYFVGRGYFSGNVGIGTTAPAYPLHLAGTAQIMEKLITSHTAGTWIDLENMSTGGKRWAVVSTGSANGEGAGKMLLRAITDGRTVMTLTGTGDVGIGAANPAARLDVAGRVRADLTSSDAGYLWTLGSNGSYNTLLTNLSGFPNNGYVTVYDAGGNNLAGMYIDSAGYGAIYAEVKSFRVANPRQPDTEIVYACIEGPEAAAYIRGTSQLVAGHAIVQLPEHFQDVAVAEGMTVQVTPCSADSKGLAVVQQALDGFVVQELLQGTGSYEFHWRVEAVRKGHEDYRVIRSSSEGRPAEPEPRP